MILNIVVVLWHCCTFNVVCGFVRYVFDRFLTEAWKYFGKVVNSDSDEL